MTLVSRFCLVAAVAVTGIVSLSSTSHAQSAEAEVLFRDGRDLIKHGKLAQGCDKLAASERLESSIGTLLNVGDCREKLGRLAGAWAAFRKAEAMAKRSGGDDKRQAEAARRAAQLEPKLTYLVVEVPDGLAGMTVRRDTEVLDQGAWNTPMPVDPGTYTIAAEAPGFVAWSAPVTVAAGAKRQVVTVPMLERMQVAAPAVSDAAGEPPPGPRMVTERHRGTWSTTRKLSVLTGIAGAGALGTGIYFGWHAKSLQDRADQRCPLALCADTEGLQLNDQARKSALAANVLYIAGGATLAAAVVLWVVGAPEEIVVVPAASDHQVGVSMTGRF
jgi:hypothetical protein